MNQSASSMLKHFVYLSCILLCLGLGFPATAQNTRNIPKKDVLLDFDRDRVSKQEFERVYAKNNGGREEAATHTQAQLEEYLDLYIKFKRKVFAAEDRGLDTTEAFLREFNQYKKQLVQPYLSAKDVEDRLVKEAFDRSQFRVSASHLLIRVDPTATPADTLAARNRIEAYRDSILNHGKDFAEMAQAYSEDPSAKENQGDLGFFTVFQMVYPFETAAFNTEVGTVSEPIRTQFGYHIVYVKERIKNTGTKRAAHIIVRVGDRYTAKTEEQAQEIVQELYKRLENGEDFAELANQFSDDPRSATRGGDLGTGRLLPSMEDYKLKLGEGEYTEPFKTPYGWHILKVTEVEKAETFEEAERGLRLRIQRDSRNQLSQQALMERIRTEGNYQANSGTLAAFTSAVSDAFPRGTWQPDSTTEPLLAQTLFTLAGDYKATVQDLIAYYRKNRISLPGTSVEEAVKEVAKRFEEAELLAYEEAQLPEKNEDFRLLLQEYRDGILLFTLMEEKVWKKAVEDTTGLVAFYEANPDSFMAGERIEVREFRTSDEAAAEQVKEALAKGMSDEAIDSVMNLENALNVRITSQIYEQGDTYMPDGLFEEKEGYVTDVMKQGSFFRVLRITMRKPAGLKPLDEARSEAITKYQDYLERTWLAELEQTYPVKVNRKAFDKLYK